MTDEKNTRLKRYKVEEKESTSTSEINEIQIEEEQTEETTPSHPLLKKTLIILTIIIIILICYSSFIETSIIDIHEYKIESSKLPSTFHGLKIIHFSDIHYGSSINKKQLDNIVKKINETKPDIIFFTGDLIDVNIVVNDEIKNEIKDSLSKLDCTLYKYAIYGDEDDENYKEIITESDFELIDNETKTLFYKDATPILITGLNTIDSNPNYTILTNQVIDKDPKEFYNIVLVHEPDSIDKIVNYQPDLIVSGHTLGGLIKLPLLKPVFLPKNAKKYYKDYYQINNTDIYISNGLGTSGINARLNNFPSINLYRLYKTN